MTERAESTIRFPCPECGRRLVAKESAAGKKATCSQCGARFEIPFPPTRAEAFEDIPAAVQKKKPPAHRLPWSTIVLSPLGDAELYKEALVLGGLYLVYSLVASFGLLLCVVPGLVIWAFQINYFMDKYRAIALRAVTGKSSADKTDVIFTLKYFLYIGFCSFTPAVIAFVLFLFSVGDMKPVNKPQQQPLSKLAIRSQTPNDVARPATSTRDGESNVESPSVGRLVLSLFLFITFLISLIAGSYYFILSVVVLSIEDYFTPLLVISYARQCAGDLVVLLLCWLGIASVIGGGFVAIAAALVYALEEAAWVIAIPLYSVTGQYMIVYQLTTAGLVFRRNRRVLEL